MSSNFVYRSQISLERRLDKEKLIKRWTNDQAGELKTILLSGKEFPTWVPLLAVKFCDSFIDLSDLRGLDLSNMDLSNVDLSYCALDFANLSRTNLSRSRLQYSRLHKANFSGATLEKTQASPVDAEGALFTGAIVRDSFFMCSNLASAVFSNADLKGSSFGGADIEGVVATEAVGFDLFEASKKDVREVRRNGIYDKSGSRKAFAKNYADIVKYINHSLSLIDRSLNVNINKNDLMVGKVIPGGDGKLLVSVTANKTSKSRSNKQERVYKVQSPKGLYSIGDEVEIVSYRSNAQQQSKKRAVYRKSNKPTSAPISLRKSKTKKWLVARLINKANY